MTDRILLINPDNGITDSNFPWGVLAIASYLKTKGFSNLSILDASYYTTSKFWEMLGEEIQHASIIGLSFMTPDASFAKQLIDTIKVAKPDSTIIVGGAHPILYPEQTIKYKNIDYLAYGDGEETFHKLAQYHIRKEGELEDVPGLMYMQDGSLVQTSPPPSTGFRNVDYSLLPELAQKRMRKIIHVLTGRGCNYKCTFCYNSVREQRWQARPAEDIIAELERIVEQYDPDTVVLRDESFFHSQERALKFLDLYKEKGFRFEWEATCRADRFRDNYINHEMMQKLAECNCRSLGIGMESGSERILKKLRKGTTVEQLYKVVDLMTDHPSITPTYSFMIGIPGENREDYLKTMNLVRYILGKKNRFHLIGPQRFRVYPGGELFDEIVNNYDISLPFSFEEWSELYAEAQSFSIFNKDLQRYPWINRMDDGLTRYCDSLFYFGLGSLSDKSLLLKLAFIPFRISAKIRLALNFYWFLYDIKLGAWIKSGRERKKKQKKPAS